MSARIDAERILDAFLAPEADRLPDRVIDAALADIARTAQRRALRVPWRFPLMTNTMRAAAGIAIVAIVGVGVLAFNFGSGGVGSNTPAPPTATPAPTPNTPGITGFTTYTSEVYGITFGVPKDWHSEAAATRKWRPADDPHDDTYKDIVASPEGDDQVAMWVWQMAPGPGADIASREGLAAWAAANACDEKIDACASVPNVALPMCVGKVACGAAVLVPFSDGTAAFLADTETGLITIVSLGRADAFPGAAKYGGAVQLLKSILTTMDVWTPAAGQIPAGG